MDLSGRWRAIPARQELRRTFHEPDLDDRSWAEVDVPGHWATTKALANERAVLHRRTFTMDPVPRGRRRWITLAGITQQGDVWLNGAYVGNTEGYFVPHQFEITHLMGDRSVHKLAIDVTCSRFGDRNERSNLMGAILDPELSGAAGLNPGGIWQPVTVHETGLSAIQHFRVVCVDASAAEARLGLRCVFDHLDGGPVTLRTRVAGVDHKLSHSAAVGENRVEWTIEIPEPDLWWPYRRGEQPLHDLTCELIVGDEVHDRRDCRTAFRTVRMDGWILSVNGQQMFTKGIVMLPTQPQLGKVLPDEVKSDVTAVRDAGLDLIRLVSHVAHPALYHTADELGLLLWQELPLRGQMARGVRTQAVRQAREMVDLLGHHPSIAVWCAHDEPFKRPYLPTATPPVMGQQHPSWNRAVLDRSVRRVLQRTDGSRPVVPHTDVPPHFPRLDGTTSHLWFGWHDRRARDLGAAMARIPKMGRFVTAFGAATVSPELLELNDPGWPALNWDAIAASIGARKESLQHLVPPAHAADGPTWARLTQTAQADVLRTTIETLRRLKYRPTGGFAAFYFADPSAAGGYGVRHSDRRVKPGWQALIDACRPVIVVADSVPTTLHRGGTQLIDIHVISDQPEPISDAEIRATVTLRDGSAVSTTWAGTVAADECEKVGVVELAAPPTSGEIRLDLRLTADGINVANTYQTVVA